VATFRSLTWIVGEDESILEDDQALISQRFQPNDVTAIEPDANAGSAGVEGQLQFGGRAGSQPRARLDQGGAAVDVNQGHWLTGA
jgi:hypothetical protein